MPIATVRRTVILPDGSIQKTIERQHKDKGGNILRILSKTTEIIPPVVKETPVVKSSVVPAPALQDPDEDYLVSHLRKRTHSKRSSSHQDENNCSAVSVQSGGSRRSENGSDRLNESSNTSIRSLHEANSESSRGDSLVEHLRRVSIQNKNQERPQRQQTTTTQSNHRFEHAEESPLPSIMVQAELLDSDQCTYRTVSSENVLADGTVVVRTENLKVYPNGSIQVLESRDQVKALHPSGSNPTSNSLPARIQTASMPQGRQPNQTPAAMPDLPTRIQTSSIPQQTPSNISSFQPAVHNPQPVLPVRVQTQAMPQTQQYLPTHLPAVVSRPQLQPSRPQVIQQGDAQHVETAEDALEFVETAHQLFGGGDDDDNNGGITFNVNVGGQQATSSPNPNNIRKALRWGRVGLQAARLGADLLGLGDSGECLEAAFDTGVFEVAAEACEFEGE